MARQLREETGLEVEVGTALAVFRGTDTRRLDVSCRYGAGGCELKLGAEVARARYSAPAEVPDDMYPQQVGPLRCANRGASWGR